MTALLAVEGLRKTFGGLIAVDDVSFNVFPGEAFALIGPNGAGKSTVLNLLSGLMRPTRGQVRVEGESISGWPAHLIRAAGVGRTFQNGRLFSRLSVFENVLVGAETSAGGTIFDILLRRSAYSKIEKALHVRAAAALERVGLSDIAQQETGSLPYGVQRKLEIARALAAETKILLLDEPAAGLNQTETESLLEVLSNLKSDGIAVVLIEHDMGLVMRWSDRIAVLNFGAKIAEGSAATIRNDPSVIEAYLGNSAAALNPVVGPGNA
ncbi:MAG: ABC transporter ATP-binding protein [Rhodospirillaceae bacterium]